jgi:hypothetical protein
MHSLTARELLPLYPLWDQFQAVRRQLDPQELFLNPYLRRLLVAAETEATAPLSAESHAEAS